MERLLKAFKTQGAHRAPRRVRRTPVARRVNWFGDHAYEADALATDLLLGYDPTERFL